jgi:hypothetical protein
MLSVADKRNALDKHLGIAEQDFRVLSYARDEALIEHVGRALAAQDYAAAQVYALLLVAERQETRTVDVQLTNWEDLAIAIGTNIGPNLRKISDSIDRLDL